MFTERELTYLSDRDFLLTKRIVINKVVHLFSELEAELKDIVLSSEFEFPPDTLLKAGKISKGENYNGLPYVILDYPRLFSQEAIFAYRTIFWWGNFFSNTLHVNGSALHYLPKRTITDLTQPLYIQTSGDPWDHSLGTAKKVSKIQTELFGTTTPFVKISQKTSLKDFHAIKDNSIKFYKQLFC